MSNSDGSNSEESNSNNDIKLPNHLSNQNEQVASVFKSMSDRNAELIGPAFKSMNDHNAELLSSVSSSFSDQIKSILEPLEHLRINPYYFPEKIDSKIQLENLKKSYREKKLVLVLGSGMSKDFGLPDWKNLSKALLSKHLATSKTSNYSDYVADLLISYNSNFTVLVRNIHHNFKNNSETRTFEEFVRDVIYEKINDTRKHLSFDEIKKSINNLDSIITYNFDDTLDRYLENGSRKIKTIYSTGVQPDGEELPIYHVHGFLPRDEDLTPDNIITLSEYLYHQLYTDIYCWSNIIQINKFTNNICLFIGTSLNDPNLRRLLDVAKKLRNEKYSHYMLKTHVKQEPKDKEKIMDKVSEMCKEMEFPTKEKKEIFIEKCTEEFINRIERFEEEDAYSFGIEMIRIDGYDEIATILSKIRSS